MKNPFERAEPNKKIEQKKTPGEFGLVKDPDTGMMVTPEELKEKRENEDRNNP